MVYIGMVLYSGANTVTLTLNELITLTAPEYVIIFVNDTTNAKVACALGTDTSSYPTRYNEFTITVTTNPNASGAEIELPNYKGYHYYVYEIADAQSFDFAGVDTLDITTLSGLVEQGKMTYLETDPVPAYYRDIKPSIKTYNE